MMKIKSEGNLEISAAPEAMSIKRRRRDTATVIRNCDPSEQFNPTCAPKTVKRSSRFRGVSKHRWTGRYEAHLWDKLSWNVTQNKKGKQVYLGAYDDEEAAARAYDLAALKYWGTSTNTNFPISDYENEIEIMQTLTKEEYLASLRRKSSGFSRGVSKYRGVAKHHHNGRWEARIGRVFGNKYLYLGTYGTQEEAAHAYDVAAIEYRGINAVTNFDLNTYIRWLKPGANTPVHDEGTKLRGIPKAMSSPNLIGDESRTESLKRKHFTVDGSHKQETFATKINTTPSSGPSTTALGLLLRSSLFRELQQKNSQGPDGESNSGNMTYIAQGRIDSEYGETFCDGSDDIPYLVSPNGHGTESRGQQNANVRDYLDMVKETAYTWPVYADADQLPL